MPVQELDSGVASEEEFHSLADVTCNCELCHARLYVSSKQNVIEDSILDHSDAFHLLPSPKSRTPNPPQFPTPIFYPWSCPMPVYTDMSPFACGSFNKCFCPNGTKINQDVAGHMNPICEFPCRPNVGLLAFDQEGDVSSVCTVPQVYISKDCVLHIRLSAYVSFERSVSAYRLINYRNNSALALNESGEYGYAYHYNCRGLINMHHGKLSITFDKDRQVLLRSEKPSFVKKEMEFYRLTSHHWTACRPVSMDTFDRDRTPEILKKIGIEKSLDDTKLRELVSSSAVHKTGCGLVSDAKIEQKVNGDVVLSWFYEDRANSLIVSPLSGSFSLSTKNLEIMATPRSDIYIAFGDFFVHVGSQQMTVSSGAVAGRCNFTKSHPCLLKLTSTIVENQAVDLRQYCAYSQSVGQTGSTPTSSHHRRQTPITPSAFSGNGLSSYCSIGHPNRNVSPVSQTSASGETTSDKRDDTTCSSSSKETHITNVKSDTSILAGPKSAQPSERG